MTALILLMGAFAATSAAAGAPSSDARIAYVEGDAVGGSCAVFAMTAAGGSKVRLRRDASAPAWSPDRRQIAFVPCAGKQEISVMSADGSNARKLTSYGNAWAPAWSPDGRRIAFARGDGLYLMYTDGSGVRRLPGTSGADDPAWSPDGRELAFVASGAQGGTGIFTMNAAGRRRRAVTNFGPSNLHTDDLAPTWSPDGRKIAYVSPFNGMSYDDDIRAVDVRDRRIQYLTSGGHFEDPAWSPNGLRLAYVTNKNKGSDIWLMNANGSDKQRLTYFRGNRSASAPAWSIG